MNLDPLWYLGTAILSPHTAAAPLGIQKVPGYDPAEDFAALEKAGKGGWMKSDKDDLACTRFSIFSTVRHRLIIIRYQYPHASEPIPNRRIERLLYCQEGQETA